MKIIMHDKIDEMIDSYLTKESKERVIGNYYPSELPMCLRKLYYLYIKPKELEKEKLRIFAVGNMFHSFMQKVFENTKNIKLVENERSLALADFDSNLVLRGRLDNLIIIGDDGEQKIVEVKSISNLYYLDEPKPEHLMQLTPYLKIMNLDKGLIIYLEKNTLRQKTFEVEYDEKVMREIRQRANILHESLKNKTLPEPEAKKYAEKSWQCKYVAKNNEEIRCEYYDECGVDKN